MEEIQKAAQKINDEAGCILLEWPGFLKACLNRQELVVKLLHLLVLQTPGWVSDFQESVRSQDPLRVRKICHTVKGATGAMHAVASVSSIDKLHKIVSAKDVNMNDAQEALEEVVSVLHQTQDACDHLFHLLSDTNLPLSL